jgi:hypothetical protein
MFYMHVNMHVTCMYLHACPILRGAFNQFMREEFGTVEFM